MADSAAVRAVSADALGRLHPDAIRDPGRIREILLRLCRERSELNRGMNRRIDPEVAHIERVDSDEFVIRTSNFEAQRVSHIYLRFSLDRLPYFMSASLERQLGDKRLVLAVPAAIFRAERRSRLRRAPAEATSYIAIDLPGQEPLIGAVYDWSPEGVAVSLPTEQARHLGEGFRLRPMDGPGAGQSLHGQIRYRAPAANGWTRLGLDVSTAAPGATLQTEQHRAILPSGRLERTRRSWGFVNAAVRLASTRAMRSLGLGARDLPPVSVVDFENEEGERLRGIVDSWGDVRGATAILIPPAWGRTKETLSPLASCIVEAFRRAAVPVVVLRFDGIRKKGESHNDPSCRKPGREHHRFTFSQGVRDIRASVDFLARSPAYRCRKVFLVSFSASSIEARRAVALDSRIGGWVSVVGSADLQSMMRVISGGIDYGAGFERGLRFGLQQILGIEVDMDHAGLDAVQNQLAFLEDSRRDFAKIQQPVTWIYGRYDAWMDAERVRDVMSRGETSNRKLIEVPTGHMLKTSQEALEAFQLVVREISRMALGREIEPVLPALTELERRMRAERNRLPEEVRDLRAFWRGYLLGSDQPLSFELMTSISPYQRLMECQLDKLKPRPGELVIDLGAGTGAFRRCLTEQGQECRLVELDFVREAFGAALGSCEEVRRHVPRVSRIECDLDVSGRGNGIPLASASADAVLGSLFLSYVAVPRAVLREVFRVLRPGGRLVVSSLRRDADMSKLYAEGLDELRAGRGRDRFGGAADALVEDAARAYLNQASRLLALEDEGVFRFWDARELRELLCAAGFIEVESVGAFGDPPQAVVVSGRRP